LLAERHGVPPQGHERLLHDLLGQERLAHHPVRQALRNRPVAAEEGAERLLIPRGYAPDQVAVARVVQITHEHVPALVRTGARDGSVEGLSRAQIPVRMASSEAGFSRLERSPGSSSMATARTARR